MSILKDMKKNAVILKKPSATIAVRADISTTQRKFYNALLYIAKKELEKRKELKNTFIVALKDLKKSLHKETTHENEYYLNELKELTNKTIEYNILNKDFEEYTITHLINTLKILKRKSNKEDVIVKFEIPVDIAKSLISTRGFFANINLVVVRGLQSKYAIIIYELAKDYEKVEIPIMEIDKFKDLFGIKNKKSYDRIDNIKSRILESAIKELNENESVDFLVSYELIKTGRKYTHIKFHVKPKPAQLKLQQQADSLIEQEVKGNTDLKELLSLIHVSYRNKKNCVSLLLGVLKQKNKDYIKAQIQYVNQKKVKNYCAYLKQALSNDYAAVETVRLNVDDAEYQEKDWKKEIVSKKIIVEYEKDDYVIAYIGMKKGNKYEVRLENDTKMQWVTVAKERLLAILKNWETYNAKAKSESNNT